MLRAVFSLLGLALMALAQTPETVLRVTSRLVQVSVVVHDRHGQPIRDLTREEFVLFDRDKQQQIAVFALQVAEPDSAPVLSVPASRQIALTNRSLKQTENPTAATVILFDSLNSGGLDDLLYAQREFLQFLQSLHPGDPVALYMLNGPNVRVIHDFTDDTNSLIAAARRFSGGVLSRIAGSAGANSGSIIGAMRDLLGGTRMTLSSLPVRVKVEYTLNAFESIANHLAGIPGRKNLIWISSGIPLTEGLDPAQFVAAEGLGVDQNLENYSTRVQRLTRILNRTDVAVYPIDPGGLMTEPVYSASVRGSQMQQSAAVAMPAGVPPSAAGLRSATDTLVPVPQIAPSYPFFTTLGIALEPQFAAMDMIASETGGRAFYNANDLGGSIRRALDDAKVTYLLGFYPGEADWDGKYHKLYVRVRRPGVEIHARRGYWADASRTESEPQRLASLQLAAHSPLEATAIGVTLNVEANPLPEGLSDVMIRIEPRDLQFTERNGRWSADLDMVFAQLTQDGRSLGGQKHEWQLRLLPDTYRTALEHGLFLPRQVYVEPGGARLRLIVRDANSGALGSVSVPTGTPKPAKGRTAPS